MKKNRTFMRCFFALLLFSFMACAIPCQTAVAAEGPNGDKDQTVQPQKGPDSAPGQTPKGNAPAPGTPFQNNGVKTQVPEAFKVKTNTPPPGGPIDKRKDPGPAFEVKRNVDPPGGPVPNKSAIPAPGSPRIESSKPPEQKDR